MDQSLRLVPGERCRYQGAVVRVRRVQDLQHVLVEYEATGAVVPALIAELRPLTEGEAPSEGAPVDTVLHLPEATLQKARTKLAILAPLLEGPRTQQRVEAVARQHGRHPATLYRWLHAYSETGSVVSLVEGIRGGKGQQRLPSPIETLVQDAIDAHYLTNQRKSIAKVILAVRQQCHRAGLVPPGDNTIRRRIRARPAEEKVRHRGSPKQAREQFTPLRGSFPGADFPLAMVQIDHTLVDLILVDEQYRRPVGRPWLTVALDVFSRMVVGFYLSFDSPGAVGTGLCLAHAILPKEVWLSKLDVAGEWPCWGVMSTIHADNAKEFRGVTLQRACEKYGINLEWRPVGKPHWGGHIERLMGTFMQEVHSLPGTTFSNVRERKDYDSEKKAALTLPEFEQWLTTFIVQVYHKRVHQGIQQAPYDRYQEGILGSVRQVGTGLPARLTDELQVRVDFMPAEERTIQEYGVVIDHVFYYADVLRQYVNAPDPDAPAKSPRKRRFVFKRDPRDISFLYFLDPATQQYHRIPYRDTSHPAMSVWEFRQARDLAVAQLGDAVNERAIFEAYDRMRAVELAAVQQTKQVTKARNRLLSGAPRTEADRLLDARTPRPTPTPSEETTPPASTSLQPFDDLFDDASFAS
ncbi:Mu transposase C-terminal domain-containing protein [Hymenobacter ruricola]|uniref:DDE-type integrase/transposase/recombinase n=1 Tax=Hymenobacter ruricola TaxID=2791023 RepID=A0ABS0I4Y7_9BACT|nr:helix-turn-helix domain-containing protein [Hymenobacter ruricola]MBF9221773.1 DDE-type integrase/transposase/recombinase [Hymenobacter ruricola]